MGLSIQVQGFQIREKDSGMREWRNIGIMGKNIS
jgi:hypothetical protein